MDLKTAVPSRVTYKAAKISLLAGLFMMSMIIQTVSTSYAHDIVWPGEKLKALYPQAVSFEQKNLYISDDQRSSIEKRLVRDIKILLLE